MTYDPAIYWESAGRDYLLNFVPDADYDNQEHRLLRMLGQLEYESVLEIGCGFGRITRLLGPNVTAIDPSADQLSAAKALAPGAELLRSTIQDFDDDRHWDLVVAIEVLMHIPPSDMQTVADKLRSLARRHIVTLDWTDPVERPTAPHNFRHDYPALFGEPTEKVQLGAQSLFRWDV